MDGPTLFESRCLQLGKPLFKVMLDQSHGAVTVRPPPPS
jgi:hypothetical protein